MFASYRMLGVFVGALIFATPVLAQKNGPEVQASVDLVRKHIDQLPNGRNAGDVSAQLAPAVRQVFPGHTMVIVRFRLFPVARIMPEGLGASNIYAVNQGGKFEHLKDVKTLERFFRANHPPVKSAKDARVVLAAWLTLTPEFHQDGMFKFDVLEKEFASTADKAAGRAIVMQGGNGELKAELVYDKDGKLAKAVEKAAIRPGPRPICQATKLLDADPLVRRIAEQDLIIMGLSARAYMMEVRAGASPELRAAIDRLWRKIEQNGW